MQPFHLATQMPLTNLEASKVCALHVLGDAPQPVVTAVAPLLAQAHLAQRQVQVICNHKDLLCRHLQVEGLPQ